MTGYKFLINSLLVWQTRRYERETCKTATLRPEVANYPGIESISITIAERPMVDGNFLALLLSGKQKRRLSLFAQHFYGNFNKRYSLASPDNIANILACNCGWLFSYLHVYQLLMQASFSCQSRIMQFTSLLFSLSHCLCEARRRKFHRKCRLNHRNYENGKGGEGTR